MNYLDMFLACIVNDQEFACERYLFSNYWDRYVNGLMHNIMERGRGQCFFDCNKERTSNEFIEFLDFIQGNGFIWNIQNETPDGDYAVCVRQMVDSNTQIKKFK